MNYAVGMKVVCLRDNWQRKETLIAWPVKDEVYVVRSVTDAGDGSGGPAIRLHWVINLPPPPGLNEAQFAVLGLDGVLNFRPVVERTTDISVFEKLLLPRAPARIDERIDDEVDA